MFADETDMSPLSKASPPRIALINVDLPDLRRLVKIVVLEAWICRSISVIASSAVGEGLAFNPLTTIAG